MTEAIPGWGPERAQLIGKILHAPFVRRREGPFLYKCDDCNGVFWFEPPIDLDAFLDRQNFRGIRVGLILTFEPLDSMRRSNNALVATFDVSAKCMCDSRPGRIPIAPNMEPLTDDPFDD